MVLLTQIYSIPCGDVGTVKCATSFSVACSPTGCVIAAVCMGFFAIGATMGVAVMLRKVATALTVKLRYWLARRICRRYARDYLRVVDQMGLAWTLALIDEDVKLSGHACNHALARAGVIDYAQRRGGS